MAETIKIKYFSNEIDRITKIDKGDWIDLRAAEDVVLKQGEFKLIPLGVGMQLPKGYEAHVVPRSSTFKNFFPMVFAIVALVVFFERLFIEENGTLKEAFLALVPLFTIVATPAPKYWK